jgi:hypothetical protein
VATRPLCTVRPNVEVLEDRTVPSTIAYQVPAGTVGQQAFNGPLGMDFDVHQSIVITDLGVFDSGSDGLAVPLTARLYNRDTQAEITELSFAAGQTGTLIGGSRFLPLPSPVVLPAGFHATIVAEGYGPTEPDGNQGIQPITLTTDNGGGLIDFVGPSRFGNTPGAFPTFVDSGPANRYAAGTFTFMPVQDIVAGPSGGTAGQAYTLNLGLTQASHITSWTINWGDNHTDVLPGNPSQATHTYTTGGDFTISATANDGTLGIGYTTTLQVSVENPIPTAALAGPTDGVRGQPQAYTVAALSGSTVEQAAGFTYTIDWGDGSPVQTVQRTAGNGTGVTVNHTFTEAGTYNIQAVATDQDGHASAAVTESTVITPWAIQTQADPLNAGQTIQVLVIGGSTGSDDIVVKPGPKGNGILVEIDEVSLHQVLEQVFTAPIDRIVVYGQGGNDEIAISHAIKLTSEVFAGDGNNILQGGGGNNILVGGRGNNLLVGGAGRNLMIAGAGQSVLFGSGGQDIMLAGTTAYDSNDAALRAILDEWTAAEDYGTRLAHLMGKKSGGLNGNFDLNASTVHANGKSDFVVGGWARDWFVVGKHDKVFHHRHHEVVTIVP